VIKKQKVAAPLFTRKYSIVNPLARTTTALESRSNPALRRSTVSQRTTPVLATVPAPVTGKEARPPDLALRGTVQTSYSAVRTSTYAIPNPLGAGYARFTTQDYPRATDTDPAEADELGILNDTASARTAHAPAGPIKHAPRAMTQKEPGKYNF
jgi:hypothetical protein